MIEGFVKIITMQGFTLTITDEKKKKKTLT